MLRIATADLILVVFPPRYLTFESSVLRFSSWMEVNNHESEKPAEREAEGGKTKERGEEREESGLRNVNENKIRER